MAITKFRTVVINFSLSGIPAILSLFLCSSLLKQRRRRRRRRLLKNPRLRKRSSCGTRVSSSMQPKDYGSAGTAIGRTAWLVRVGKSYRRSSRLIKTRAFGS
uniref:Uncharacterized protein n=1 Tax=Aegilops tauschii subsp. strangulata TaxID=200361 RepID=A0A453QDL6_AEGTS